jgi:predicted Zn-dependent peptidase
MYKDLPHFDVLDRCRSLHFGEHCCGNSVLGTVESIKALTSTQMRDYFSQRYAPDNMVLACAGNAHWEQFVADAKALCGGWAPSKPRRVLSDFRGTGKKNFEVNAQIQREHLCLMSAAPSMQSTQYYAALLLSYIIGDDTGSRYYWALVDSALADSAELDYDGMDGTGAFYTYISCDPEKSDEVVGLVRKVLNDIQRNGVKEDELQASKNKLAAGMTLSGELPMGRLVPLGFGWIYEQLYRSLAEEIAAIQAVTVADIRDLVKDYSLDALTIQGLGPVEKLG